MPIGTIHKLHAIQLGMASGALISQLGETAIDSQIEEFIAHAAGHPMPLFTGVMQANPTIRFSTPQIASILAAAGIVGQDQSAGNTDLYFKKAVEAGTRVAAASTLHMRFRAAQAHLSWSQLRAAQGQIAEIDARLALSWDGTNLPLVPAGSTALAGTPTAAQQFTLGPVSINGSPVPVTEYSLESGIQLDELFEGGEIYPSWIGNKEHNPIVLTLKTPEATVWTSYGVGGTALSALSWYLRAKEPDAGNYSNASTEHILFEAEDGIVLNPGSQGRGNDNVMTDLRILLRSPDATTDPFVITTGSAIT